MTIFQIIKMDVFILEATKTGILDNKVNIFLDFDQDLKCKYNKMVTAILLLLFTGISLHYEIINAFNCGSQTILQSPLLKYTSDQMYEGLTSKSVKKEAVPSKYIDPIDMQLLSTERTSDNQAFSYFLRLKGPDQYLLLLKFIEVIYNQPGERIFQVKFGDQIALEIDIVKEVGTGEVLHKIIEFELKDEVLFINGTIPALNGYIYPKQLMKLTFNRVMGEPKIQALILVKGADRKFLNEYLQYESSKNKNAKQYISERYHKPITFPYRHMTGNQTFDFPEEDIWYYVQKFCSINTVFSIIAVIIVLGHERIYERFNLFREEKKND